MKKLVKINSKIVIIKLREPFAPTEKTVKNKKKYTRKIKYKNSAQKG